MLKGTLSVANGKKSMRKHFFVFQWKIIPSSWFWDSEHGPSRVSLTFEAFLTLRDISISR